MSEASDPAQQPSLQSLQKLAETKCLSEILKPSFKDSDFESLEPCLQRLLFGRLRAEIARLQKIEQSHLYLKKWLPQADAELYTPAARKRIPMMEEDDEHDENSSNGY